MIHQRGEDKSASTVYGWSRVISSGGTAAKLKDSSEICYEVVYTNFFVTNLRDPSQ